MEKKRLFIGIKLQPEAELLSIHEHLQILLQDFKIKWVEPHNFHITLKFLGNIDVSTERQIEKMLEVIGNTNKAFKLHFDKPEYFLTKSYPSAIWYGFKPSEEFARLSHEIQLGLRKSDIKLSYKKAIAHLTLGRIKNKIDCYVLDKALSQLKDFKKSIDVQNLQLFQSILKPEGPIYTTRKEFLLDR